MTGRARPRTGFLLFCESERPKVKENAGGQPLPLAQAQIILGQKWKTLAPDEKEQWMQKAVEHNATLVDTEVDSTRNMDIFPVAHIQRIIKFDNPSLKVSLEACECDPMNRGVRTSS
eukprot:GHVU01053149.1.p1 GENE.GHVU01053149.1~~GHVU01053149.1.p1  ORF type:complete len:117 (-),score=13.29 GHVU01053149.1:1313-1663(-)